MKESEISYIAGLFDGEGSIYYKKAKEKKKKHTGKGYRVANSWRISMEVTMTDPMVINWLRETLKVGVVSKKPRKGLRKDGTKYLMQYRWRCTFRDAYFVCCLIYPYSITKLEKVKQVLDHYQDTDKIVNLEDYRMTRAFNWNLHGT
jgi:hypothetical protein|tara:strand:- start:15 stop:455 length:441 start_codon:yes stop_codon:yes gene_type:complete